MAIYSSLDITSNYDSNPYQVVTEKTFFKDLIEFGGGVRLTDAQVSGYATTMFANPVSIDGFPGLENEITYTSGRCLTHFAFSNTGRYWNARRNDGTGGAWIKSTYISDYTTTKAFTTKPLSTGSTINSLSGQVLTGRMALGPFQTQVAYYNYLYNGKLKLELTTTDGGLTDLSGIKIRFRNFRLVDTNGNRNLCSGVTYVTTINNGSGLTVYNKNLYFDKEDTVKPQYLFEASANTSTTYTYMFYGPQKIKETTIVNGVENDYTFVVKSAGSSRPNSYSSFILTSATSLTNQTVGTDSLPVKVSLMLNVVRNIDWINIHLEHLLDESAYGVIFDEFALDLSGEFPGYLNGFTHRVAAFRYTSGKYEVQVPENSSSVDALYEVWDNEVGSEYIARIKVNSLSNYTTGYRPGLQLKNGMWLCSESYNVNDGPPVGGGDYSSSWTVLKDDHAYGYMTDVYFSAQRNLYLFHNLSIINTMATPVEINGVYIGRSETVFMALPPGEFTITVYNDYLESFGVRMYLDQMGPSRFEFEVSSSNYYTTKTFNTVSEYGDRGGVSFIIERK